MESIQGMRFVSFNDKIVNIDTISVITFDSLVSDGHIDIHYRNGEIERVAGREAVEIMMRLCPSALEGHRLKFLKHRWAIHNLIGHPLMQLLSWLGCRSWGLRVHDATVPVPKPKGEETLNYDHLRVLRIKEMKPYIPSKK